MSINSIDKVKNPPGRPRGRPGTLKDRRAIVFYLEAADKERIIDVLSHTRQSISSYLRDHVLSILSTHK